MSSGFHEQHLSQAAQDQHRALASLQEELEAVDWYNQRADVAEDAEVTKVLQHNMYEEIEHACMLLEWLRRNMPGFDENLNTYLFKSEPITEIEEAETGEGGSGNSAAGDGSLGLGALK